MRYAVRCCCQPRKVFGWLELPAGLRDGDRVQIRRPMPPFSRSLDPIIEPTPLDTILIRMFGEMVDGRPRHELAVYSEDRPESFWRALPNFTPAD